jgi:hypothetical protein
MCIMSNVTNITESLIKTCCIFVTKVLIALLLFLSPFFTVKQTPFLRKSSMNLQKHWKYLNSKKENKVLQANQILRVHLLLFVWSVCWLTCWKRWGWHCIARMWFCLCFTPSLLRYNMLGSPSWLVFLLSYKTMKDLSCISMINYSISLDFVFLLRTQSILWPRLSHPVWLNSLMPLIIIWTYPSIVHNAPSFLPPTPAFRDHHPSSFNSCPYFWFKREIRSISSKHRMESSSPS